MMPRLAKVPYSTDDPSITLLPWSCIPATPKFAPLSVTVMVLPPLILSVPWKSPKPVTLEFWLIVNVPLAPDKPFHWELPDRVPEPPVNPFVLSIELPPLSVTELPLTVVPVICEPLLRVTEPLTPMAPLPPFIWLP